MLRISVSIILSESKRNMLLLSHRSLLEFLFQIFFYYALAGLEIQIFFYYALAGLEIL